MVKVDENGDELGAPREGWDNKWQYLMAVISYAVVC